MNEAKLRVLNPAGISRATELEGARRPGNLEGLVVGFLDNTKNNVDRILPGLEEEMQARYGVETIMEVKETSNRPADPGLLTAMAARCNAVVTGVGD